jgi:hypothetical protein
MIHRAVETEDAAARRSIGELRQHRVPGRAADSLPGSINRSDEEDVKP